ncbi:MAG: 50S ribosomal protein L24 [bacterium]
MNIRTGDQVKIIAGKDKSKTGKVLQVFPKEQRASVQGLNLLIKHLRPQKRGEPGQRIEFPAPLNLSNLMLLCPKCGKATRVGFQISEVGEGDNKKKRKVRVCRKCKKIID